MEEQTRARAASVESVFVGISKADKFGEGALWLACNVVSIPAGGRHVVAS